jgi:hypothetical protein
MLFKRQISLGFWKGNSEIPEVLDIKATSKQSPPNKCCDSKGNNTMTGCTDFGVKTSLKWVGKASQNVLNVVDPLVALV